MSDWNKTEAGKEYRRAYRKTESGRAEKKRWKKSLVGKRMNRHTFTMVDGEGWTDENGKHHYMTLTIGTDTLYGGEPLTGVQCLEWLSSYRPKPNEYLVSFFFDYDVTMILRDMAKESPNLARQLFAPSKPGALVWWKGYGIGYRPKKHLRIKKWNIDPSKSWTVTIHDVQGFFQSSFVVALEKFGIGTPEERKAIEDMKANRSDFSPEQALAIIEYSENECRLGADLVGALRDATHLAKVNASPYEGPGDMARRAIANHYGRDRHQASIQNTPNAVQALAGKAYYGGRFEITAHGPIVGSVYEYDIKSAYPAAMLTLPCLVHGKWVKGIQSDLWISGIRWGFPDLLIPGGSAPFPVRRKDGSIYYPIQGEGVYWSHEVAPYVNDVTLMGQAWSFLKQCDCVPFSWVHDLYTQRQVMEHEKKGSGIALKLMLNTLYGKLAQTRPTQGSFFNMVYASLITSLTRRRVFELKRLGAPIIMFATDAVFSLMPLEGLDMGEGLGQWEHANTFHDMTIFQPGVYFDGDQAAFKTRGVPKKIFRDNAPTLKAGALDFNAKHSVKLESHLGLRLALARGTDKALSQLGDWVAIEKNMTSSPAKKRDASQLVMVNGNYYSYPIASYGKTVPYTVSGSKAADETFRLDDDLISDGYYEGEF
jgi:hypothetical protein